MRAQIGAWAAIVVGGWLAIGAGGREHPLGAPDQISIIAKQRLTPTRRDPAHRRRNPNCGGNAVGAPGNRPHCMGSVACRIGGRGKWHIGWIVPVVIVADASRRPATLAFQQRGVGHIHAVINIGNHNSLATHTPIRPNLWRSNLRQSPGNGRIASERICAEWACFRGF